MNNTQEIPADFPAGWQALANGSEVRVGDLLVYADGRKCVLDEHHDLSPVGSIPDLVGERIYRRMPVPKQGDLDHSLTDSSCMDAVYDKGIALGFDIYKAEMSDSKAKTYDEGKPPLAQLPWAAIRELSMVQLYGARKYKDYNNYRKGMEVSRNISCAIRHLSEYMDGCDNDTESGRSHLGHAMCRIAFVLQNLADGKAIDDRWKN